MEDKKMCIFCDIIEGKIPSAKVYEDDQCLAILDISQVTRGHTLVMPKKHFANILEYDEQTLAHLIKVVRDLAGKIVKNLDARGCNILVNTNEAAGQSVMHLHFHIIPRYGNDEGLNIEFDPHHEPFDLAEVLKDINKDR